MPVPAFVFTPEKAHCPACLATLFVEPETCPFCGYNGAAAVARFPDDPLPWEPITDPAKRLTPGGRRQIESSLRKLARTFPQISAHIAILQLPQDTDAREYGFWWFNRSLPSDLEEAVSRPWSLLLIIDRFHRCASVTTGYALEIFLGDMTLEKLLSRQRHLFQESQYPKAIRLFFADITDHLVKAFPEIRNAIRKSQARNPQEDPGA